MTLHRGLTGHVATDFGYDQITGGNDTSSNSLFLSRDSSTAGVGFAILSQRTSLAAYTAYNLSLVFHPSSPGWYFNCMLGPATSFTSSAPSTFPLHVNFGADFEWNTASASFVPVLNGPWDLTCMFFLQHDHSIRLDNFAIVPANGYSCRNTHLPPVSGYKFLSCQTETAYHTPRALSGATATFPNMTVETCAKFCSSWPLLGLENASECYCGDVLALSSATVGQEDCYMQCAGESSQICGGPNRLSLYYKAPLAYGGASPIGCYNDPGIVLGAPRTLSGPQFYDETGLTIEACANFCSSFAYFGLEYGHQWLVPPATACPLYEQ